MSYCRFSNADVYVYMDVGGYLCCCGCSLSDDGRHYGTSDMVAHLREHIAKGDDVPDDVIPALEADAAENDAEINRMREATS